MSAALAPPPQLPSRSGQSQLGSLSSPRPSQRQQHLTEIRLFPSPAWPLWLKSLLVLQWGTGGAAVLVLASLLPIYGLAAFHQHQWGQAYKNLTELEQQERQLQIAHQAQRYQVAERIERQPAGFVPQSPKQVLFIPRPTQADVPTPIQATLPASEPSQRTVSY
ncbi:hypothetical protein [Synechococcus sp. PCC 6312]|uniref:hypothetical protein n=1 Tax=Synechococcus sp. (strain ATCC 27167 / PCC 6312) TaxID=195253 RepID=UPI00029EE072|nr:hypothetical protein [Synechococcus sp. PCC 6312]AFY62157.1 hypothetical protein Syn6312_3107 [Synechococcus sp. PCC 6312]